MVTFRNNNRRNNFRRNTEILSLMEIELNFHLIFQVMIVSKEKIRRNNHNASKLIENIIILLEKPCLVEIRFYQKTISNMLIILQEFR